jgi:photosystem II stability/assembly factor-like uncharacterized protein
VKTLLFWLTLSLAGGSALSQNFSIQLFKIHPSVSIRAIAVVNDQTLWFAGNRGIWGYTTNGGKTWTIDSLLLDSQIPEFRSIAVLNDSTVLIANVGSPAYIFRTTNRGKDWYIVYTYTHKDIFFDCMIFNTQGSGLIVSDPVDGEFFFMHSQDQGRTWKNIEWSLYLDPAMGESFFAASNSNLDFAGKILYFATGGIHSRLFAVDKDSVKTYRTPLPMGEKMTGIFSLDFLDAATGLVAGGHYEHSDSATAALAITRDGGNSWTELKASRPFFGSCVQFISDKEFIVTGHKGTFMGGISSQQLTEVKMADGSPVKMNTLRASASGKTIWMAGSKGEILRLTRK